MAAELHALQGQLVGLRLELGDETVTIGRDPGNQVILTSKRVGRRHAELRCEGAQYLLLDLNSRNGTFVNGERVTEPRLLRVGDQIAIADELFTLVEVAAPIAVLEVVAGELAGRSYELGPEPLAIGRGEACAMRLTSRRASRQHAELCADGQGFVLHDLGSQNGTFVNGVRLTAPQRLRSGDEIVIGDLMLRFTRVDDERTDLTPPAVGDCAIACPHCGRAIAPDQQHCPWDGTLLANGQTVLGQPAGGRVTR